MARQPHVRQHLLLLTSIILLLSACAAPTPAPTEIVGAGTSPTEVPTETSPTVVPPTQIPPTEVATEAVSPTEAPSESTGMEPQYGGTMVVSTNAEPPHLNPLNNLLNTGLISGQLFPALLKYNLDMTPKPWLAESWEISDDLLTYTFHLVENAAWTDGTPITSDDVKFSFEELILPYHPSGESNFSSIETIETPDDHTVIFKLKEPYTPFMVYLSHMMAPIFPKHVYEGSDPMENPNNFEPTVTGGPFVFKEWVSGDHITLVRNDDYWIEGLPYLDQIIFRFIPEPSARVIAIETGDIDYIPPGSLPESEVDSIQAMEGVELGDTGFEAFISVVTFGMNTRKEPFNNVLVRQALAHAVNNQFILQAVYFNHGLICEGPIPPTSWAYDPSISGYDYDPEKAKQLLDEAGYPEGDNGIRFSMSIVYRPDTYIWAKSAEVIADNLSDIGVDVELRPLESAAYYPAVYEDWDFDMAAVTWGAGPDPNNISAIYHSDNIRPLIFTNFMGYSNPEVDALFDEAKRETDKEKRKDLYGQIQAKIIADSPAVWTINPVRYSAYKEELQGIPPGPWYGTRDPADEVWIKSK